MPPTGTEFGRNQVELSRKEIDHLVNRGLARTFEYVLANSPFYRKRFRVSGLQQGDVKSVKDLTQLPFTSKQDIAEAGREMWCVSPDDVIDVSTTSGTTGAPTLYPMTRGDIERLGYNEALCFDCAGLTKKDTVLLAVTMDRCFIAGLAYFEGLRRIGATVVRVGCASPMMALSMMEKLDATAIVSVPSFLKKIADHAAEKNLDLTKSSVKKLVCIGEPVRTRTFELTPLGRQITQSWGAQIYSTYGVTELATSFCECGAGRGGHLLPELIWAEIVDDQGRATPAGQVGEIVATTFGVEAMPLMRFKTGDCSFVINEQCTCGRWTARIGPIVGRKNQMMKIKGTTVFPAAVQAVLDGIEEVAGYVMVVTSESSLSDQLEIIAAVKADEARTRRKIQEHLQAELKVTPSVRIADLNQVESLQQKQDYRKKNIFIDRRSQNP